MRIFSLCLASASLALTGAAAAQTPATTSTEATPVKPKKPKRVCRERGRPGSHLSNVVCKTPDEWAALQQDFDDQDEFGIPGSKVTTSREMNVSPPNRVPF